MILKSKVLIDSRRESMTIPMEAENSLELFQADRISCEFKKLRHSTPFTCSSHMEVAVKKIRSDKKKKKKSPFFSQN